jgi:hypothetical protein
VHPFEVPKSSFDGDRDLVVLRPVREARGVSEAWASLVSFVVGVARGSPAERPAVQDARNGFERMANELRKVETPRELRRRIAGVADAD